MLTDGCNVKFASRKKEKKLTPKNITDLKYFNQEKIKNNSHQFTVDASYILHHIHECLKTNGVSMLTFHCLFMHITFFLLKHHRGRLTCTLHQGPVVERQSRSEGHRFNPQQERWENLLLQSCLSVQENILLQT